MTQRGQGLAARLKAAMADAAGAEVAQAAAQLDREQEAIAARAALFVDLEEFVVATCFLELKRKEGALGMKYGERVLWFREEPQAGEVSLRWDALPVGVSHRIYREPMLKHRWVWRYVRRGREDRLPLFDQGLELLLVDALGLPALAEGAPLAVQPSGAAAVVAPPKRKL